MEGEAIGMVIARATELRSKIRDCIDRSSGRESNPKPIRDAFESEDDEDEVEEAESLVSIRDAFESLEQQLSSLQALQQQQRYERESALSEIDRSRMILLSKLKDYKGEELEVIHEASSFAGGSMEHDGDDLILPPYPTHLPDSYVLEDLYPFSRLASKFRPSRNEPTGDDISHKTKKSTVGSEELKDNQNGTKGLMHVVGFLAKSVLTVVGVVSVLGLAGFKPTIEKRSAHFNILELFTKGGGSNEGDAQIRCPPGKVLVVEEGKPRCLVKERIEIPFERNATTPNISYGFG